MSADRIAAAVAELVEALREDLRVDVGQPEPPTLLDVDQAAKALGISRTTLYGLLDRPGGVPTIHVGRRRLVARSAVDAFAQEAVR